MVHTVGIVGVNGNVGAAVLPGLVKAAQKGEIKLTVFHRQGSSVKGVAADGNVTVKVLNFDDPADKIEQAVKGINVFISTVGFGALPSEPNIVDALAKSPDLVTYIPSVFSTTWDERDFADEHLGPVLKFLHQGWDRAKEKNIGITAVYTGVFDFYYFGLGFTGSPIKANTIWANAQQLEHKFPIVAMSHLGDAIARIATSDPQSIRGKDYSVVTFWPTGDELLELYSKLNGGQAASKDFTKVNRDEINADGPNFGPAKVGYLDRWEQDRWGYDAEGRVVDTEYQGSSLEDLARQSL